ncbi:SdpI family protein [Halobacillus litoralis]|uniref:SdpI family protein n=1 Tax=Halobacillus litoralis TaxID=45668 RepID=UPI001CD20C61|nr:SdpI family protein [Halobacillus litoralis]
MLIFLTGLGCLAASIVLWKASPDNINSVYGYRTKRSKKNKKLWDFAQKYSAKVLCAVATFNIVLGFALMFVTYSKEYYLFYELGWSVLSFLPVFLLTERKLIKIERSQAT